MGISMGGASTLAMLGLVCGQTKRQRFALHPETQNKLGSAHVLAALFLSLSLSIEASIDMSNKTGGPDTDATNN
jgi:hypothetical protein